MNDDIQESTDINKESKSNPFRQRKFEDVDYFNRDLDCKFEYNEGDKIRFLLLQTKYYDRPCKYNTKKTPDFDKYGNYTTVNKPTGVSGYLVHFGLLSNGKKITIVSHSEGINKLWIIFEDVNTDHNKAFAAIYNYCIDGFGFSILPKYKVRDGKLVNLGYFQNFQRKGIEIYFKQGRDLIKFCDAIMKCERIGNLELHIQMKQSITMMTDFTMMNFAIANGMWYEPTDWILEESNLGNLEIEISMEIRDMIPVSEDLQSELKTTVIIATLDIEARIINDFRDKSIDMFKDYDNRGYEDAVYMSEQNEEAFPAYIKYLQQQEETNSAITNICIYIAKQDIPGESEVIQAYNLVLVDGSINPPAGFYNDDGIWVKTIPVTNTRDLAYLFSIIIGISKPDLIVGHNSNSFDIPALISLMSLHEADKNIDRISCLKINDDYSMSEVWSRDYEVGYKISQMLEMKVPKVNIPGIMLFDTMMLCVTNFNLSTMYVGLTTCAKRLGFSGKYAMSHLIMFRIYRLLLQKPIDNNMPDDEFRSKMTRIVENTIEEFHIAKVTGEIYNDFVEMKKRLNDNLHS